LKKISPKEKKMLRKLTTKNVAVSILALSALLILSIFLFYPAEGRFTPSKFNVPKPRAWEGALAPNRALQSGIKIGEGELEGPEELTLGPDGKFYTGTGDGKIKRFTLDGEIETYAKTGGRPAALDFDKEGNLYVSVGYKGLMKIYPDGTTKLVAKEINGIPLSFVDGLIVGEDGYVYFSLASAKYTMHKWIFDFFESNPNGMLLRYDPKADKVEVLGESLYFPNGIVYHPSGEYLLFNETSRFRVMRYWLKGDKVGTFEVFAENLPGLPDGISMESSTGNLIVALSGKRTDGMDKLLSLPPFIKNALLKLSKYYKGELERYAIFIVLSPEGEIIKSYHDPDGSVSKVVTGTIVYKDKILIGSFEDHQVLVINK
jgi:sugar lactone lactonase YvrE